MQCHAMLPLSLAYKDVELAIMLLLVPSLALCPYLQRA
jgi:hypothetical protein